MADIRIVKTGSDTYSVIKDGKTITAKDTDGDGKLTAKDGAIGLSQEEWTAVVKAQSNPVKSTNSSSASSVSVFSSQYEPAENIWQYATNYAGRTISYPMDSLAAYNDGQVWNYVNSVNNGWNSWLMQMNKLTAFLKAYDAETMKLWAEIFKTPTTTVTETEEAKKKKETAEDTEAVKKLKEEVEKLKKELEERSTVKSYRDSLKDTGEFDLKVQTIAEKLKEGMKGLNFLGMFGNVGGDKRVADTMNDITAENVVEVMEYYKTEICDKGYMGDDYNLIESIYDDFSGKKYTSKIEHLKNALADRATALIADYGEECPISAAEIEKFKADVDAKKGNAAEIPKVFEEFKNKLKKAEGGIDRKITPEKKEETTTTTTKTTETTTSSSKSETSSSSSETSSSSEAKKQEKDKK